MKGKKGRPTEPDAVVLMSDTRSGSDGGMPSINDVTPNEIINNKPRKKRYL